MTEEKMIYEILQALFAQSIFLTHFNSDKCFYIDVDASKQYGFEVVIYHIDRDPSADAEFSHHKIHLILFLSKLLTPAECNYWFIKMETVSLV